jgi:hypothetical protein
MTSKEELTDRYVRLLGRLWQLHDESGLCAGVYTQTTDVEGEVNGLLTYDREVLKVDEARTRDANLGKGPRVDVATLIKTAQDEPAEWKYTTENPRRRLGEGRLRRLEVEDGQVRLRQRRHARRGDQHARGHAGDLAAA